MKLLTQSNTAIWDICKYFSYITAVSQLQVWLNCSLKCYTICWVDTLWWQIHNPPPKKRTLFLEFTIPSLCIPLIFNLICHSSNCLYCMLNMFSGCVISRVTKLRAESWGIRKTGRISHIKLMGSMNSKIHLSTECNTQFFF